MTIRASNVGHVVLRVSDLGRSTAFYCGVLGLREVARRDFGEGPMAFLSTGNAHHDIALVEVGPGAPASSSRGPGLHHFALRIGDDLGELREAERHLRGHGIGIQWSLDHRVSQGIYVADPDGHLIELYVDADPDLWRNDPSLVANSDPLAL